MFPLSGRFHAISRRSSFKFPQRKRPRDCVTLSRIHEKVCFLLMIVRRYISGTTCVQILLHYLCEMCIFINHFNVYVSTKCVFKPNFRLIVNNLLSFHLMLWLLFNAVRYDRQKYMFSSSHWKFYMYLLVTGKLRWYFSSQAESLHIQKRITLERNRRICILVLI